MMLYQLVGEGTHCPSSFCNRAVDQLTNELEVRLTKKKGMRNTHFLWKRLVLTNVAYGTTRRNIGGCLQELDEDTIVVYLQDPQELQDFSWRRSDLIDTGDTDDEVHLELCRYVEVAGRACCAFEADLLLPFLKVLLRVGLRTLEDDLARGLRVLQNRVSRLYETKKRIQQIKQKF